MLTEDILIEKECMRINVSSPLNLLSKKTLIIKTNCNEILTLTYLHNLMKSQGLEYHNMLSKRNLSNFSFCHEKNDILIFNNRSLVTRDGKLGLILKQDLSYSALNSQLKAKVSNKAFFQSIFDKYEKREEIYCPISADDGFLIKSGVKTIFIIDFHINFLPKVVLEFLLQNNFLEIIEIKNTELPDGSDKI